MEGELGGEVGVNALLAELPTDGQHTRARGNPERNI